MSTYSNIQLAGGWYVETWYNRQIRQWTSQLKNSTGDQIGDAQFDHSHDGVKVSREMLQRRHAREFSDE